jgi:hypothetical protein
VVIAWIVSGGILLVSGLLALWCLLAWVGLLTGWMVPEAPPPAPEPGIVIVAVGEDVENARCAVCRTPLGDRVRRCRRCRTLHHADCWTWLGGCAVFACDRRGGP